MKRLLALLWIAVCSVLPAYADDLPVLSLAQPKPAISCPFSSWDATQPFPTALCPFGAPGSATSVNTSPSTEFDKFGNLVYAPNNQIRNSTMQGASAGNAPSRWNGFSTGNGITVAVTGTEVINGITYVDGSITGTATASGNISVTAENTTSIPAAPGQTWTESESVAATNNGAATFGTIGLQINEANSSGTFLQAHFKTISPTATPQPFSGSFVLVNASVAFAQPVAFVASYTSGQTYSYSFKLGAPQLEIQTPAQNGTPSPYYATGVAPYFGPRITFDPATPNLGIAQNYFHNSAMVGASAGTPGIFPTTWGFQGSTPATLNLASQVVATGIDATTGYHYIDYRLFGTPNLTTGAGLYFDSNTSISAATGQTWSSTVFLSLVGGSLTNVVAVNGNVHGRNSAGGGAESSSTPIALTSKPTPVTAIRTMNNSATAFASGGFAINLTNGQPIDITIRIEAPQLSLGGVAPYVATTGTAIPATFTALGYLPEQPETEGIRNNTMQGAVAETPGTSPTDWSGAWTLATGLSQTVVGTGTENGIPYIDFRIFGTATATTPGQIGFEGTQVIAAVNGQVWTQAIYARLIAGSFANISGLRLVVSQRASDGTVLTELQATTLSPTGAPLNTQRKSGTVTLNTSLVAFVEPKMFFTQALGAVDFTLRIGEPSLAQTPTLLSNILTYGATTTRNADLMSMALPACLKNPAYAGLVLNGATASGIGTAVNQWALILSDGTVNNRFGFYRSATSGNLNVLVENGGSVVVNNVLYAAAPANTNFAEFLSARTGRFSAQAIGHTAFLQNSGATPNGLTTLNVGTDFVGATQFDGTIAGFRMYCAPAANDNFLFQKASGQ
jgi:hypothetical protein